MTLDRSPYLEPEVSEARLERMRRRVADEAAHFEGEVAWGPESDYWRLPATERERVEVLARRSSTTGGS